MKAIGSILRSYLHRRLFILLLVLFALYLFFIANALIVEHPGIAWLFFLYASTAAAAIAGFHLRQMIEASEADLLPNHRGYQITAAGIILSCFLLWPLIMTGILGSPVIITLAVHSGFMCAALWIAFFSSAGLGLTTILGFPIIIWLCIDLYRSAGSSPQASLITQLGVYAPEHWPVYLLSASVIGLGLFVFIYMRMPNWVFPDKLQNDFAVCLSHQDWTGPYVVKRAAKAITHISATKNASRTSLLRSVHLIRFALFSPVYAVWFYASGTFIYCLISTYLSFHQDSVPKGPAMDFLLPSAYFYLTAVLAADFLAHRNRLPAIYLQSALPSRNAFSRAVILSYLWVVIRQTLGLTFATLVVHAIFPWTTWTNFPQLCLLGFIMSSIQVSISLMASARIKTTTGFGWMMANILAIIPIVFIARLYSHAWAFIAAGALFSGLLFWASMRRWVNTELNFAMN